MSEPRTSYVSNELTHFVGRSKPTDEERFQLLVTIIRGGVLLDPTHQGQRFAMFKVLRCRDDGSVIDGLEYSSHPSVRHDTTAQLSDNSLIQFEVVCFCDIPFHQLALHCSKYGPFGIAFEKSFLVGRGAGPVMYVPIQGEVAVSISEQLIKTGDKNDERSASTDRPRLFNDLFRFHNELALQRHNQLAKFATDATMAGDHVAVTEAVDNLWAMLFYQTSVEAFLFGFLKFFDSSLPSSHPENYYMEREWRIAGRVLFEPTDIRRVIVPREFVDRARKALPDLAQMVCSVS